MAQPDNQHFTTEQLSAYIDKQLSPQEQAVFDTHVQSCERCQGILADLRLTRALLRAMPREEAPRSFTLPTNIAILPPPVQAEIGNRQPRRTRQVLRNTFRAVSTIAAVIGLLFIMGGLLTGLGSFHGGGASTGAPMNTSAGSLANTPSTSSQPDATRKASGVAPQNQTPSIVAPKPTPSPPAEVYGGQRLTEPYQPSAVPALLDISTPVGLLGVGFILFVLGIVGGIAVRRWWRA